MSKLKCIALTLLLLFTLSACSEKKFAEGTDVETQPNNQSSTTACIGLPTMTTIEEYEEKLLELQKLTDFVEYDEIKEFGEFECFVILEAHKGVESSYLYGLIDENGYSVDLCVYPASAEPGGTLDMETILTTDDNTDMRTITEARGIYHLGTAEYVYCDGVLCYIEWATANHKFNLSISKGDSFTEYSAKESSLVASLLNAETAPAAIAEFNSKVSG